MENKENFLFGLTLDHQTDSTQHQHQQTDIQNLQKVVLQSFKYCQAKKSKNKYIRLRKVQEMKTYQKKLVAIVKKKSDDLLSTLIELSNQMISNEQSDCNQLAKNQEESLNRLKSKIASLKSIPINPEEKDICKDQVMRKKIKRVTFECEQELQKMESEEKGKKTDDQIEKTINDMEKPFKKLCSYFSILTKEIKELQQRATSSSSPVQ